jgi:hypothetical protein
VSATAAYRSNRAVMSMSLVGLTPVLSTRWVVGTIAVVTSAVVWYSWGYLRPTPIVHDEASYLFQAQTFALGRLANPSPVIPVFFEQFHVLVAPTFASKYPPGMALLMVPGVWLGLPALGPVLLAGISAVFMYLLACRIANAWVAVLTWLLWLSASRPLDWSASYFSENATVALWLIGWWMLLKWSDKGRSRHLIAGAVCVGWMAITRPLTAVAYAIPMSVAVVSVAFQRREWTQFIQYVATVVAIVSFIVPINEAVGGKWYTMPWTVWAHEYAPSDRLGFGISPKLPERQLPTDMSEFNSYFAPIYAHHTPDTLLATFLNRSRGVVEDMFGGWRSLFLPFAAVGLIISRKYVLTAVLSALLLLGIYLGYAHAPWTLYYIEIQPTLAFLAASGIWRIITLIEPQAPARHWETPSIDAAVTTTSAFVALMLAAAGLYNLATVAQRTRDTKRHRMATQRLFAERAQALAESRAIVFIRYGPGHNAHRSLIANEPDLTRASVWFVYDRGDDNRRLLNAAPDRLPYMYDERTGTFSSYSMPQ